MIRVAHTAQTETATNRAASNSAAAAGGSHASRVYGFGRLRGGGSVEFPDIVPLGNGREHSSACTHGL
jgi:hypothetical protein